MRNSRFVFTWILGLALVYRTLPVNAGDAVPVLIWDGESSGSPSSPVNPLLKTSQVEFEKILMKKVGGSPRPVLVFLRDSLCVEDFTQHKEGLMHLKDGGTLVYLPAVDSPLSVFENLPFYNQTTEEELETVADGQLIITQAADLDAISETFNMVKESSPNLIAALTGRSCGYSRSERSRRQANVAASSPTPVSKQAAPGFNVTGTILMYANHTPTLQVSKDTSSQYEAHYEMGNNTRESPSKLIIEYLVQNTTEASNSFKVNISIQFPERTTGYYYPKVSYQNKDESITLLPKVDVVFPRLFSYHCSNITFANDTIQFNMIDFQVQVNGTSLKFADAYDCVGFTSIPIWSGIFVTAIFAVIMIWGLTMMMDIRTMDRFDDPKGKTITISAAE